MTSVESAREAYDRFAAVYDDCNAENDYEMWLGRKILPELERHGLRKGWALDVGCGTGRAFEPLLARGWRVVGCDVSAGMLDEAQRKFGGEITLFEADARSLPTLAPAAEVPAGEAFDLVLLLNDVLNYLVEDGDLDCAFAGVKKNLAPGGLVAFDLNTVSLFREDFAAGATGAKGGREWRGLTEAPESARVYEAQLSGPDVDTHVHRQRHWGRAEVTEALEGAGLRCLAALGQREQDGIVQLSTDPDEERDSKLVYLAAASAP